MLKDDNLFLESFENIYSVIARELQELEDNRSVYKDKLIELKEEIRAYCRIFEDISLPARLILEQVMDMKQKSAQIAIEAQNMTQNYAMIKEIKVLEFGVIRLTVGEMDISWHDREYNYLLYPDKVELRTLDEKSVIKLFFSNVFDQQIIDKFSPLLKDEEKVIYIHPSLK